MDGEKTAAFGVGTFFLGILAGAVIGGVAALLMAPKSGPETRDMLKDRFSQMKEIVRSKTKEAQEHAQGAAEEMQSRM